jgi:hypothetical protein
MVTARGREPAAADEQYRMNSTMARVLYRMNSTTQQDEQFHVNSTVTRVTVAQEQYRI